MRILIIGSSGFIGKELAKRLEERGYAFDITSRHDSKQRSGIRYFDFQNSKSFANIFDYDVVIMTAFDHRYSGNLSFVKYLMKHKFSGKLIYLSTISVIDWNKLSQGVEVYSKSLEIYSWVKRKCEKSIVNSKLNYCVIRPSVVLGGGTWHSIFTTINESDKALIPNVGNNYCYFVHVASIVELIVDNLESKENKTLNAFGDLKTWKSLITTEIQPTNANKYCDSRVKNWVFLIIYNSYLGLLIQYLLKRYILSHGRGNVSNVENYEATNTIRNIMSINFRFR